MDNFLCRVKLEKVEDTTFNGEHPNGINVGSVREGFLHNVPKVGESLEIRYDKIPRIFSPFFMTSWITKIEVGFIHTENSVYTIDVEKLDDEGKPFWEPMNLEKMLRELHSSES